MQGNLAWEEACHGADTAQATHSSYTGSQAEMAGVGKGKHVRFAETFENLVVVPHSLRVRIELRREDGAESVSGTATMGRGQDVA